VTVATRDQVLELLRAGHDYGAAGQRLGIPAGQAYLIATGRPADGGDTVTDRERERRGLSSGSQQLPNPPAENPTGKHHVRRWIEARVAADSQQRAAGAQRESG
jgi:hypothetical protein